MGKIKYIECQVEVGKINEQLEVKEVQITLINSEKPILPRKSVNKGQNKRLLCFRLQKGIYNVRIIAFLGKKSQKVNKAELILNEKGYSWKGLPEIFFQCFRFSWHTQSK